MQAKGSRYVYNEITGGGGFKEITCGKSSGKPFDGFQGTYGNTLFSGIKEKLWRIVI